MRTPAARSAKGAAGRVLQCDIGDMGTPPCCPAFRDLQGDAPDENCSCWSRFDPRHLRGRRSRWQQLYVASLGRLTRWLEQRTMRRRCWASWRIC